MIYFLTTFSKFYKLYDGIFFVLYKRQFFEVNGVKNFIILDLLLKDARLLRKIEK